MTRALVMILAVVAAGCGADPCEEMIEAICAEACACGDCAMTTEGGLTVTFAGEDECAGLTQGCGDATGTDEEYAACRDAVGSAECREGAVLLPEACE